MLSRPVHPGGHPLRALRTGLPHPTLPASEWAGVSCDVDPVGAMELSCWVISMRLQWAAMPADLARIMLESGALHQVRRIVKLGAAHAGRCAARPAVMVF